MGSFVPQDYRNEKMKYTQKKLDMKMDYQQRYGDAWEALYPRITEMQNEVYAEEIRYEDGLSAEIW